MPRRFRRLSICETADTSIPSSARSPLPALSSNLLRAAESRSDGRLRDRRANMPGPDWRKSVIEYIRAEARPVDKFGHQPRLYALASRIGRGRRLTTTFSSPPPGCMTSESSSATAHLTPMNSLVGTMSLNTIARTRELLPAWGFPAAKLDAVFPPPPPISHRTIPSRRKQPSCATQTYLNSSAPSARCGPLQRLAAIPATPRFLLLFLFCKERLTNCHPNYV